jgi:hypothetical protein
MKMYGGMELLVCGILASTKMEVMHVPSTSTPQKSFQFARIGAGWTLDLAYTLWKRHCASIRIQTPTV